MHNLGTNERVNLLPVDGQPSYGRTISHQDNESVLLTNVVVFIHI